MIAALLLALFLSSHAVSVAAEIDGNRAHPDERILWQLYHAGKIEELKRQIDNLQQSYPLWRPPLVLLKSLAERGKVPGQARPKTIKRLAYCDAAARQWHWAQIEVERNQAGKAVARYRTLIRRCQPSLARQTLEQARSVLASEDFVALGEWAKTFLTAEFVDRQIYAALKAAYLGEPAADRPEPGKFLRVGIEQNRDWQTATVVAWRYFNRQEYAQASRWFQLAESWNEQDDEARFGQLLSLEKLKYFSQLLEYYEGIRRPSPRSKAVAARVYKKRAWQNYETRRWQEAAENIERARAIVGDDEEVLTLIGWVELKRQHLPQAASVFERLYQQYAKKEYAQAYILAQSQLDRAVLRHKAADYDGILAEEYRHFHARELYRRKQFQSAYLLAPEEFPALANIDTSYLDLEGGAQHRSGENGRSHLDTYRLPSLTASYTVAGNHQFSLALTRIALYSGGLSYCGSEIAGFPDSRFAHRCRQLAADHSLPEQRLDNALAVELSYRKDGWFSPYASLGSTPIGGAIGPAVTFRLGFMQQTGYGNWGLEAFSQPVRQSMLSYVGTDDPYQGKLAPMFNENGFDAWGRVLKTGMRASQFIRFAEHWNVSGSAEYAWLHGENVADNHAISVAMSVGRELNVDGFDYFTVGPSFNYQHFDKNLGHYTFGHGGYFSPEQYANIGAGINFLTDEGRDFIIKGQFTAGLQVIKQQGAPWFPRGNSGLGHYSGDHSSGEALDFEVKGVWLLTPHLQLGAGAAFRKTNGYQDYTGGLFIRYTLEQRKAVFSRDIPRSFFDSYY